MVTTVTSNSGDSSRKPCWVGVFQDASRAEIESAIKELGLSAIQCHGAEPPEFVEGWHVPVIKAISVPLEGVSRQTVQAYTRRGATILLDAPKTLTSDEKELWLSEFMHPLAPAALPDGAWLAGGLSPETIEAVLSNVRPACLDVASGIEIDPATQPGVKDPEKLKAFCQAVRRLEAIPLPEVGTVIS